MILRVIVNDLCCQTAVARIYRHIADMPSIRAMTGQICYSVLCTNNNEIINKYMF